MHKTIHHLINNKRAHPYFIALAVFLFILLVIVAFRVHAAHSLRQRTDAAAIPVVQVISAQISTSEDKIILPGNVSAWHEAPIYARTNGYVKNWYFDIGAQVKAGDLLADIETPELNAQQRQAVADLQSAIANNELAQSTAKRWTNLVKTNSVSKQERDEKVSSAHALEAMMIAARANLERLNELVSFERVVAPFDGIVTARAVDIGDLINSGSSTSEKPLFRVAQTNPLRIYVKIPQNYSTRLSPTMSVRLHFAEHPTQTFTAHLLDTAHAIDPTTRTLLAQFEVENKKGILLPGGYTEVSFSFPLPPTTIRLPVNTLIFQSAGLQVAIVDKDNKIQLKSITISRDLGTAVELATGIQPGDRVVLNPSDSISNGELVRIVA